MYKTNVVCEGEGRVVVLIHGVGLDLTMWEPLVAALGGGFRVLRYDVLGHGGTDNFPGQLSFDALTNQLALLLDEHDIERIALVGFSLGALIAQAFTLAYPERVDKLVLLNSACRRNSEQQAGILARLRQVEERGVGSNVEASVNRWFTDQYQHDHPAQIELIESRLSSNDREGFLAAYRLFARSDSEFTERLHEITVPTLVITGSDDVGSTPDMSRFIASQIRGAELQIFADVKHMLPMENADKLGKQLIHFLNED